MEHELKLARENGESKGFELATQEQLEEYVRLAELFTAGTVVQSAGPNRYGEVTEYFYQRQLLSGDGALVEVYRAVDVGEETWVAGAFYDYASNGVEFTKHIGIDSLPNGEMSGSISWDGLDSEDKRLLGSLPVWNEFDEFSTRLSTEELERWKPGELDPIWVRLFFETFGKDYTKPLLKHEADREITKLKSITGIQESG